MKDNKFFVLSFVAVLVILFIFTATQIPMANTASDKLPLAIVVEDSNPQAIAFAKVIQEQAKDFKWTEVQDKKSLDADLTAQKYYGAIIIPKDFTQNMASMQTAEPKQITIDFIINQGKNAAVASKLTTGFTAMGTALNDNLRNQTFKAMAQKDIQLSAEQAKFFAQPLQSNITSVHEIGSMTTAPLSFFQPVWMASIIAAVMLWFAAKNRTFSSFSKQLQLRGIQIGSILLLGLLVGYATTFYSTWMLDYSFDNYHTIALFLSIAAIAFIALILACLSWIGYVALPVFVLLMFFGLPLLQMAPELLSDFYTTWIMTWIPFQFLFDGLRDILFFDGKVWNDNTVILMWMAIVSGIIILLKGSSKKNAK